MVQFAVQMQYVGIISPNHEGQLSYTKVFNLGHTSALTAEATSLHQGIKLALHLGIQDIIIEGDNLLVINDLNNF